MAETGRIILSFDDGPDHLDAFDAIPATLAINRIEVEFYVLGDEAI
jgi:hypothetical protein